MGNKQAKFPLPEEIITQILLLLPLHSLLACKCVSKQWRHLIKNPRFVKQYQPKGTALFLHKDSLYSLLIPDHDNKKIKPRRVPIGPFNDERSLLVESSNKRACAKAHNGDFLVYDLVTGDSYKVVPPLKIGPTLRNTEDWFYHRILSYGFGYDPYTNDFKIVFLASRRIDKYNNGAGNFRCDQGFVHSFKNGGWKSFKGFNDAWYIWVWSPLGYDFNGVLHWLVGHGVVATMDLHSGRLAEIALPGTVAYEYNSWLWGQTLGELDGHLCFCIPYGPGYSFDMWVMKEYGVEESWTKLLSIGDEHSWRLSARGIVLEWTTHPVLYSIEGGAKVAFLCLSHDSKWRVFEYDLREDTVRVMQKTTWVKDKIVRWFKRSFQCHGGAIP